jgi:hypothetical protein
VSVKIVRWVLIIGILVGLLSIGVNVYLQYNSFSEQIAANTALEEAQQANGKETLAALEAAGVPAQQASQGFWYITTDPYGDQSVAYFDLTNWSAMQGLTQADIETLAATIASSTVVGKDSMHAVSESDLPPDIQFNNQLYAGGQPGQFADTQGSLEVAYKNGTATADQLWELSYMYELQGDYADRDAVNAADCKLYGQRCAGTIPITLRGLVVDESGNPIEGATVSVLDSAGVAPATTDAKGDYTIALSALPLEKIRVSAVKRNFTDGVASAIVIGSGKSVYDLGPIELTSPIVVVTIDTAKHTVTNPNDVANPDGSFVLQATSSTYDIPAGAIVHPDGTPYSGPVDVYIYEFTKDTVPQNLVTLDTFNSVVGFVGNIMESLGMPYIQFFTPDGQQLDVMKSDPMILTYQIPGWEDMKDNYYNRPEGPLTDQQIQTVLAASQADPSGFPITAQFLADNKISTFAAFWVFDRKGGIWDNEGMRLLNAGGTMQAPFYTTNDQRQ